MINICVGDLVESRRDGKVGVVVDAVPPNQGMTSMHMRHVLTSYHDVYYVFFSDEGKVGPFHVTELALKQAVKRLATSTREL